MAVLLGSVGEVDAVFWGGLAGWIEPEFGMVDESTGVGTA